MTTFVKQYGLERTGTNAVRTLLEQVIPDVTVLMHVLGDKHSLPVDLARLLEGSGVDGEAALRAVVAATELAPARTTDLRGDRGQLRHLEAISGDLVGEVTAGRLRVLVSTREPYGWVAAYFHWKGWRIKATDEAAAVVGELCDRHNRLVRQWLDLVAQAPRGTAAVVSHEELLGDLDGLVARLVHELDLPTPVGRPDLPLLLGAADWDHERTPVEATRMAHRGRRRVGRRTLPRRLAKVVDQRIDWDLVTPPS
jgi:hypothetical protein